MREKLELMKQIYEGDTMIQLEIDVKNKLQELQRYSDSDTSISCTSIVWREINEKNK
jgi:hypothetical protein